MNKVVDIEKYCRALFDLSVAVKHQALTAEQAAYATSLSNHKTVKKMEKTQKQIDELAVAFYDGMASVTDRIEEINKVEETNAYIKKRFGVLPSDSELIIEGTFSETKEIPVSAYLVKYVALFFALIFGGLASYIEDFEGLLISSIFACTFFIMFHIEKFSKR